VFLACRARGGGLRFWVSGGGGGAGRGAYADGGRESISG